MFLEEMSDFLACVRGGSTPAVSLADGAVSLRVALAARASLETGSVVNLS
jgi:predicted dehydrogenase